MIRKAILISTILVTTQANAMSFGGLVGKMKEGLFGKERVEVAAVAPKTVSLSEIEPKSVMSRPEPRTFEERRQELVVLQKEILMAQEKIAADLALKEKRGIAQTLVEHSTFEAKATFTVVDNQDLVYDTKATVKHYRGIDGSYTQESLTIGATFSKRTEVVEDLDLTYDGKVYAEYEVGHNDFHNMDLSYGTTVSFDTNNDVEIKVGFKLKF